METPATTAPSTRRPPLVNGTSAPEPSFAYTDLRGIGTVDIDDLLDYVHDSAREFPSYLRLYEKYLKQRWDVTELDFATDARDWNERMSEEERDTFLKMASGFHHGERQVTVCLGPLFMGIPEDYRIFLSSHLEDEARHTIFFDRFYREVVGMPGDTIMDLLDESYPFVGDGFTGPFGLLAYLTDDLRRNPYDRHLLMQYAVTYMLWIEGVLALSSMKVTLGFARDRKVLPAYYGRLYRHLPRRGAPRTGRPALHSRAAERRSGAGARPARDHAHPADVRQHRQHARGPRRARVVGGAREGVARPPTPQEAQPGRGRPARRRRGDD